MFDMLLLLIAIIVILKDLKQFSFLKLTFYIRYIPSVLKERFFEKLKQRTFLSVERAQLHFVVGRKFLVAQQLLAPHLTLACSSFTLLTF